MFTSEQLVEGKIYTRKELGDMFGIKNRTIDTGVFPRPAGHQSIWLFVTEEPTKGSPQYKNLLHENLLYWDGQTQGRTDKLIIDHQTQNLEILVFYRTKKREFPHGGFRYEGRFSYVKHEGSRPTQFLLERIAATHAMLEKDNESSQIKETASEDDLYVQTAKKSEDPLKRESPDVSAMSEPLKLLYCYARKDKNLRDKLDTHLSVMHHLKQVASWYDYEIQPGMKWEEEIDIQLNTANIILLLVSPDFMASKYCYGIEMRRAIERHERGAAKVIPVILRPIHGWQDTPIGKLQALPTDGKPVVDRKRWPTLDHALENVAIGIRGVINSKQ